jgi:hypothetical protein
MENISRSRSRSVSTAPFTRATGLSVTTSGELCAEGVGADAADATAVGAWDETWAETVITAPSKIAEIKTFRFIAILVSSEPGIIPSSKPNGSILNIPILIVKQSSFPKKKGEKLSLPHLHSMSTAVYWKTVGMLLVLLASFASPKWH